MALRHMWRLAYILLLSALTSPAAFAQDASTEELSCTAFPFDAPLRAAPDTTYDVEHVDLSLDVDEDGHFAGRAALDVRLTRDVDRLFVAAAGTTVDSVFFGAVRVDPADTTASTEEWSDRITPGGLLEVVLPDTITSGSSTRVVVYHRGRLPRPAEGLLAALDPLSTWFPSSPNVHDRFTAELRISVPRIWTVAASGIPTGQQSVGEDRMRFGYSIPEAIPGRRIALAAGLVDLGSELGPGRTAVSWWMPRERTSDRPRSPGETLRLVAERLQTFTEWTGRSSPFQRYTQVHLDGDPAAGAALVRIPPAAEPDDRPATLHHPPAALTRPLLEQWFGVLVSAASWEHVWMEAAFPTYLGILVPSSAEALRDGMTGLRRDYLEAVSAYRPLVWNRWNHPAELMDAQTAARGAWVLHMIRREVGDEAFREAVDRFLESHAYGRATTAAWMRAIAAAAGRDLTFFSGDWIYSGGHPVLDVSYASRGNALEVRIEQIQTGDFVPNAYALDLTLEIGTLGDVQRFEIELADREDVFELPFSGEPRFVAVDPDGDWLLESRTAQPPSAWIGQLRQATTSTARLEAARALSATPQDPALLLGLRSALEAESSALVRAAMVEAIGELPWSAAAERALIAAYDDPDARVRRAVLHMLADSSATSDAAALALRAAETDAAYDVQAEAVRTLARLGTSNALDVARAALVTPSHDEVIRASGLDALGMLLPRSADEALREALRYAAPEQPRRLRLAATTLLGRLASTRGPAVARLVELLGDDDPATAAAAVESLRAAGRTDLVREHAAEVFAPAVRAQANCS